MVAVYMETFNKIEFLAPPNNTKIKAGYARVAP